MDVSSHNVVGNSLQNHSDTAKGKSDGATQNRVLSSSVPASQQLDIELLLNTGTPLKSEKQADGMAVFDRLLSDAYRKLNEQFELPAELEAKMSEVAGYNDGKPVTAEKASNNILGFIERRLMLDKVDGATQEELQSRLAAGLEGFEKGFAQAKEQLEALALLSPAIGADIEQTYNLVQSGIDRLRDTYLAVTEKSKTDSAPGAIASQSISTREVDSTADSGAPKIDASNIQSSLVDSDTLFAQRNNFSFDLKTLDGDTVTIRASAQEVNVPEYGYESRSSFSLQVTGVLDEDELKAINDLLSQVNDLADTFYSGDVTAAFGQALEVGYNSEEIAQFALTLTHSEVQKIPSAYQQEDQEKSLVNQLQPIGAFAEQLLAAIDSAKSFSHPLELLQQLTYQIDISEDRKSSNDNTAPEKSSIKFVDFVSLTVSSSQNI